MPEEKSKSNIFLIEKRAERRVLVHMPVEVTEIDGAASSMKERTFIEDVSDFGCRFSTRGQVQQGDTIAVKILGSHGNILPGEESHFYEVMWVAAKERGFIVGARLITGEKLANVKFPPENGGPKQNAK